MAETTQLELVTPARVMVSKAAEMVVVPGSEGLFGVLPATQLCWLACNAALLRCMNLAKLSTGS